MKIEESNGNVFVVNTNIGNIDFRFLFFGANSELPKSYENLKF